MLIMKNIRFFDRYIYDTITKEKIKKKCSECHRRGEGIRCTRERKPDEAFFC